MKQCKCCKKKLDLSMYFKNSKAKDGLSYYCKDCQNEKKKAWRKANPETQSEAKKRYYEKNRDRILEYNKEYYKTERGLESKRLNNGKRRALIKSTSDGTVTYYATQKLLKEQEYKCNICDCDITNRKDRHLDHIKPLSKGGTHIISNVQWLCIECNMEKLDNY